MIINLRGPNGSGKTSLVQNILNNYEFHEVQDGYYVPPMELFIAGPYINSKGQFLPTGGGDQLTSDDLECIVSDARDKYRNILFEKAAASYSFKRWACFADGVGFYDYMFLHLNTEMDQCIANKDSRPTSHGATDSLIKGWEGCKVCVEKLFDNEYQLYVVNRSTAEKIVRQVCMRHDFLELGRYLSGGGKRVGTRSYGLYCSISTPEFEKEEFIRDSRVRLDQFEFDFKDRDVLEFGSNVGGLSFEIMKRGAKRLRGYEYNPERVLFCNRLSKKHGFNSRFFQVDLNEMFPDTSAEVVVCCAVDDYVDDVQVFYNMLFDATEKIMLFECNVQSGQTIEETIEMLKIAGFTKVEHLGRGACGKVSKKRTIYKCYR